jgi:hypothetical protein
MKVMPRGVDARRCKTAELFKGKLRIGRPYHVVEQLLIVEQHISKD